MLQSTKLDLLNLCELTVPRNAVPTCMVINDYLNLTMSI